MKLVPALTWQIAGEHPEAIDPRLLPLLAAIADSSSLAAAIARCGISYRAAWGLLRDYRQRLGVPLVALERGRGARLTAIGEKWLDAHGAAIERLGRALPALAVEMGAPPRAARRSSAPRLVLAASHDLALAEFAHALPETANLEIDVAFMGSLTALREYAAGRAGLAGFHVALSRSGASDRRPFLEWLSPRRDRLIRFVDRDQGLILPRGNPRRLRRLGDVAAKGLRFVNRQRGSGTRLLIDQMLATEHIDPATLDGYAKEEFTHAAIAATVASGGADAGFGLSAAAAEYGLAFVPLTRERYFLAVRARAVESAGVKRLLAGLRDAAFTRLVHGLPGYSSAAAGTVVEVDALSASV